MLKVFRFGKRFSLHLQDHFLWGLGMPYIYTHLAVVGEWKRRRCWRKQRSVQSSRQGPHSPPQPHGTVVNMSSHSCRLTTADMPASDLSLDVTSRHCPQNAVLVIEVSTTHVLPIILREIRSATARILKGEYLHKSNLNQRERTILGELQNSGDIYILPANTMVILNS